MRIRLLLNDINYDIDPHEAQTLAIFLVISCFLAVMMSSLIIGFYIVFSKIRKNLSSQIVIIISILELIISFNRMFVSIYTIMTNDNLEDFSHELCVASGFLWNFLNLAIFFLILFIGFLLYIEIRISFANRVETYKNHIFLLIFVLALFFSCLPFINNSYGKVNEINCWINSPLMRMISFDLPFLIIIGLYIFFIISFIRNLKTRAEIQIKRKLAFKFLLFPLLMIICWIPAITQKLFNINNFALKVVVHFLTPLQGVFIPVIYGLINKSVKQKFISFFCCQWQKLKSSGSKEIESLEIKEEGEQNLIEIVHKNDAEIGKTPE